MNVANMDMHQKLELAITKAAKLLPGDVGEQLLAMLTPSALATMAAITGVWAGAHFFGIGELADLILIVAGWVAVGGVAVEASKKLYEFVKTTYSARTESDLDEAATCLAAAITLIGVDTVMAILLKKNPRDAFRHSYRNIRMPRYSASVGRAMNGPRNSSPSWRYRPKIRFTDKQSAGLGSTNMWGDITIGRAYDRTVKTAEQAAEDVLVTLYHERVHSSIAPKFYLLRELRAFMHVSAYHKSYILRYLEEAFAELVGLMRAKGMSPRYVIDGFKFPLTNNYEITFTALRHEAAGVLLGPVVVGGAMYNVYYGIQQ